jgi:hypothetical protein
MKDFESWYAEIIKRNFFEKYALKAIIKMAWMAGSIGQSDGMTVGIMEKDEDLILSEELDDPNFAKNHPELGLLDYKPPSLSEMLSKEELENYQKEMEEKRNAIRL